jgi:hypothetical protein
MVNYPNALVFRRKQKFHYVLAGLDPAIYAPLHRASRGYPAQGRAWTNKAENAPSECV